MESTERMQSKAYDTTRMLEEQGYTLDLGSIVGQLPEDAAAALLQVLQDLCEDKQESAVAVYKNRSLLTKLAGELELQRKENVSPGDPFMDLPQDETNRQDFRCSCRSKPKRSKLKLNLLLRCGN